MWLYEAVYKELKSDNMLTDPYISLYLVNSDQKTLISDAVSPSRLAFSCHHEVNHNHHIHFETKERVRTESDI